MPEQGLRGRRDAKGEGHGGHPGPHDEVIHKVTCADHRVPLWVSWTMSCRMILAVVLALLQPAPVEFSARMGDACVDPSARMYLLPGVSLQRGAL